MRRRIHPGRLSRVLSAHFLSCRPGVHIFGYLEPAHFPHMDWPLRICLRRICLHSLRRLAGQCSSKSGLCGGPRHRRSPLGFSGLHLHRDSQRSPRLSRRMAHRGSAVVAATAFSLATGYLIVLIAYHLENRVPFSQLLPKESGGILSTSAIGALVFFPFFCAAPVRAAFSLPVTAGAISALMALILIPMFFHPCANSSCAGSFRGCLHDSMEIRPRRNHRRAHRGRR